MVCVARVSQLSCRWCSVMTNDVVVSVNHGVHVELKENKVESDTHHNGSDQIGQQALLWGHEAGGAGGSWALGPSSLQRSSAAISSIISLANS